MHGATIALVALALAVAAAQSRGEPHGWGSEPQQIEGADIVFVDEPALVQTHYRPAGGPLSRYTSRSGAWYVPVFVPLAPGWPVQLWVWQRARTHEVRLLALDRAPLDEPTAAVPLPALRGQGRARAPWVSAPFAISSATDGDGAFVLIEQWSASGERPGPIWVQVRSRLILEPTGAPWWSSRTEKPGSELAPAPPPSPLQDARDARAVVALPFKRRFGLVPQFTPWADPWVLR
ncbi:MAG: hypothetical protein AB1761_18395 [Pseudomonadota bacterium]